MNSTTHRIYISTLVGINLVVLVFLLYKGLSYYSTPVVERFYHNDHVQLKPSGSIGHGYGIIGTLLILIGVFSYIARKKMKSMAGFGRLKYWLEFHIFLCTLGPMLVLFHTAFKFGGLVSVSFWSMVAVVASGVIGRFIYIQIPRTIEGRELSLAEANALKRNMGEILISEHHLEKSLVAQLVGTLETSPYGQKSNKASGAMKGWNLINKQMTSARKILKSAGLPSKDEKSLLKLLKQEIQLQQKIDRLQFMQKIFRYWHVAHLPFAFIMLIIMVIHVVITLMFGYRWIF